MTFAQLVAAILAVIQEAEDEYDTWAENILTLSNKLAKEPENFSEKDFEWLEASIGMLQDTHKKVQKILRKTIKWGTQVLLYCKDLPPELQDEIYASFDFLKDLAPVLKTHELKLRLTIKEGLELL